MDATELRIGNLVQTKQGVFQIAGIHPDGLWIRPFLSVEAFSPKLKEIQPVRITEEVLQRFGGRSFNTQRYYFAYGLSCIIDEDGDCRVYIKKHDTDHIWFNTINFAHQLQNIYQAYVGKELEYK